MKAIIVDDEIHVREAIEIMIQWEDYGIQEVFYAQNGQEALRIIEEKRPDILFCDMEMPVMDGKALLEEIVKRKIKIQVIAISGYSDFKYVHATLLAKGIDYILKPISHEALIGAVEKTVSRIEGEKADEKKLRQHAQMGIAMAEQVLQRLCKGEPVEEGQFEEALAKLGAEKDSFLLVSILNRNAAKIIERRYGGDRDLCFFTVGNILRDIFKIYSFSQEIFMDEYKWILLLQEEEPNPFRVTEKMKIFERKAEDVLGLKITWVICSELVKQEDLRKVIPEQNSILLRRSVWGMEEETSGGRVTVTSALPRALGLELRLLSVMESGDENKLRVVIRKYCDELRGRKFLQLWELQNCTADMNLLLRRIAAGKNMELRAEPISLWVNDIDLWEEQVTERFENLMQYFPGRVDAAEEIYSYIKEHYAEDITLSSIAADFYQTPQNVTRVFKNRYQMTIVTAITGVRMEKACEQLRSGGKNVAQVAESVGYEDENYFIRVFKKYMGITPAQYRKAGEKEDGRGK